MYVVFSLLIVDKKKIAVYNANKSQLIYNIYLLAYLYVTDAFDIGAAVSTRTCRRSPVFDLVFECFQTC